MEARFVLDRASGTDQKVPDQGVRDEGPPYIPLNAPTKIHN